MARTVSRPPPTAFQTLEPLATHCPDCGQPLRNAYANYRTVTTLTGVVRLTLRIRRCTHRVCPRYGCPYRPEEEGRLALRVHEFGLDVVALTGTLRYRWHRMRMRNKLRAVRRDEWEKRQKEKERDDSDRPTFH